MTWNEQATQVIEDLLDYSISHLLIEEIDRPYYRNLLLDAMSMDAPADMVHEKKAIPRTATHLLQQLCNLRIKAGRMEDLAFERDLFSARIMGLLTPSPREVRQCFNQHMEAHHPERATDDFYQMCKASDYIKVDAIAQNVRYFADTKYGKLEITINLSKPEKDPREIARLKNAPSVGYPKCMLCVENPGYAGRNNFPARQNHRMIPLTLGGEQWFLQYSPYAYYDEHCIVLSSRHVPIQIGRGTFQRLFAFVDQFPHYMIGSNADLPIVGGSILTHDHFQGGRYRFPMDQAGTMTTYTDEHGLQARWLYWPMTALQISHQNQNVLINEAERILRFWRSYSDPACDILAFSGETPHNTITPILRKNGEEYTLTLVLRNNRTSDVHPLGIFHPHAKLHPVKKENIGLIEVMGLFILPGRLKTETEAMVPYLTGEQQLSTIPEDSPLHKHVPIMEEMLHSYGHQPTPNDAIACIRRQIATICGQVLEDAGVFKLDEHGKMGMKRFMTSLGYTEIRS